jgi:hypothetical protein
MSLVNIGSVQTQVLRLLDRNTAVGTGLELLSYKRDRGLTIIRGDGNSFRVRERGFVEQEIEVDRAGLPRLLKTLIKREFPRSRKVRLYKFTGVDELERERQKI